MPEFTRYTPLHGRSGSPSGNRTTSRAKINHPDQLPIFLIPGIFGNKYEMKALATELNHIHHNHGHHPIYIYSENSDKPVSDEYDSADELITLEESDLSKSEDPIIAAIGAVMPDTALPYLLIGYSDGGKKAVNAAKSLQNMGHDACVLVIDATPEAATSAYFNSGSIHSFEDLINIVNYAATLSGMNKLIALDNPGLNALRYLAVQSLLEELANKLQILNANTEYNANEFAKYIAYTNTLLSPLKRNESNIVVTPPKMKKITAIFTNDTLAKYAEIPGHKWENEATEVECIPEPDLARCTHKTILLKPNASLLANAIDKHFLSASITEEDLLKRQSDYLKKRSEDLKKQSDAFYRAYEVASNSSTHGSDSDSKADSRSSSAHRSRTPSPALDETLSDGDVPVSAQPTFFKPKVQLLVANKTRYHTRRHS